MFDVASLALIFDSSAYIFISEFELFLSVKNINFCDIGKLILESLIILF